MHGPVANVFCWVLESVEIEVMDLFCHFSKPFCVSLTYSQEREYLSLQLEQQGILQISASKRTKKDKDRYI